MKWNFRFAAFLVMAVFVGAGCSVLPGLKVLSGQDTGDAAENRLVETSELVMADKGGTTDPALNGVADRIETASGGTIDIIEIRNDLNTRNFQVYALLAPQGGLTQIEVLNRNRRAIELTWRGIMQQSASDKTLQIVLLDPQRISTLDKGDSFVGVIIQSATIDRADAIVYLASNATSLQSFASLITDGKLALDTPSSTQLYSGTPNHPVTLTSNLTGGG
ncbi:MAG: hypothetical protein ABI970_15120 [Chloroflexota bacterium]